MSEAGDLLITGGGGFVGRRVLARLGVNPWPGEVWLASRQAGVSVPGFASLTMDLAAPGLMVPRSIGTVLHIAGEKHDPAKMDAVNHLGTRRLAEAAAAAGARRFVYVSSVGSYGAAPGTGIIREDHPHSPRDAYESSKDAGETAVREIGARTGIETVILQPSNVIGHDPAGASRPLLGLMRMIARGWMVWFGRQSPQSNYISADDVAAALRAGLDAPSGTYILNTPAPLGSLVTWICEELGCKPPRLRTPRALGAGIAGLASGLERLTGRALPFQRERFAEMTNTNVYDPSRFVDTHGFAYPAGIEAFVRGLAQLYRQEGLV